MGLMNKNGCIKQLSWLSIITKRMTPEVQEKKKFKQVPENKNEMIYVLEQYAY